MRNLITSFLSDPFFATKIDVNGVEVVAIIQPASDDDLQILPEGDRFNPTVRIFSKSELSNGDIVKHNGFSFRIISNGIWTDYGYFDVLATRHEGSQSNSSGGFVVT